MASITKCGMKLVIHSQTYPFPNFNSATIEVGEWINNLIPDFAGTLIIHAGIIANPCL